MTGIDLIGIGSALMVLSVFVANQYGKMSSESIYYDAFNFVGSIGLLIFAAVAGVIPFVITNSVWALVSGADVVKYFLRQKGLKKGLK